MGGLWLALGWLTVLPVPRRAATRTVDRRVAAAAIRWAPVAGLPLGALTAAVLYGLTWLRLPPLVAAFLALAATAVATRGMHVDGLADTADGLGCYGPPERALAVMRDGRAGPFAVVTLVLVLGAQAGALARLAVEPARWPAVVVAALA